jgi:hypothetical protein
LDAAATVAGPVRLLLLVASERIRLTSTRRAAHPLAQRGPGFLPAQASTLPGSERGHVSARRSRTNAKQSRLRSFALALGPPCQGVCQRRPLHRHRSELGLEPPGLRQLAQCARRERAIDYAHCTKRSPAQDGRFRRNPATTGGAARASAFTIFVLSDGTTACDRALVRPSGPGPRPLVALGERGRRRVSDLARSGSLAG